MIPAYGSINREIHWQVLNKCVSFTLVRLASARRSQMLPSLLLANGIFLGRFHHPDTHGPLRAQLAFL